MWDSEDLMVLGIIVLVTLVIPTVIAFIYYKRILRTVTKKLEPIAEPEHHLKMIVSEKETEFLLKYNALMAGLAKAFVPMETRAVECLTQYKAVSELLNLKEQELLTAISANVKSGEMAQEKLKDYIGKIEAFTSSKSEMVEFIKWIDEEFIKRGEEIERIRSEVIRERRAQRIKDRLDEDFWKSPEGRRARAEIELKKAEREHEQEMSLIRAAAERTAMDNMNRMREEEHRRQLETIQGVGKIAAET